VEGALSIDSKGVEVKDAEALRGDMVEHLVRHAVFHPDEEVRQAARWLIRHAAQSSGIYISSIHPLYAARGRGACGGFTVPAVNLRTLVYDSTRAMLRAAKGGEAGAIVFEIARSEMGYTDQRPAEYAAAVTGAAIREGWSGPLFIQGDHFQVNAKRYGKDPEGELSAVRSLIGEALQAGFYNIDIDTSTLVDLSKDSLDGQQELNYRLSAELTKHVRDLEPEGLTVSVGGEIGEVGGKNSTVDELRAYMDGYRRALAEMSEDLVGISKISVQTGTAHGGVVLPDGSVAEVALDFEALERLSRTAREGYGTAGAVQHGASTLPEEAFHHFPERECAEIHLATGFQNLIYEHDTFPKELREEMYQWLRQNCADEKKPDQTDEQFFYKTRKKAFGPFKKVLWDLPGETREAIGEALEREFLFLFEQLNVNGTSSVVAEHVAPKEVSYPVPEGLAGFLGK
jgi:fructose/tagatose bisphosphate aldolase